jgi:beta-lactamase superfamily II metal-dependent hydrolase
MSAAYLTQASAWAANKRSSVPVRNFARKYLEGGSIEITVLDVGQASAALIKRDGTSIGLFDAGAPIWFNKGSLPKTFSAPAIDSGFVFLSHWDFDHFDLGRRHLPYQSLSWFAPNQLVGPNTALFQDRLGSNLTFVHGATSHGGFRLAQGTSPDPKDRNGTGYQLRYENGRSAVLLTGDADYQWIRPAMRADLDGVTVPHHGGRGTPPPTARGRRRAIVSYGEPNSYHHPHDDTLSAHKAAHWTISYTAQNGRTGRGDRTLFP